MRIFAASLVASMLIAGTIPLAPVHAQSTSPAANSQQDRMKSCNATAGDQKLAGDARKSFMSDCLSGKTAQAPAGNSQQQKMKTCNDQAGQKSLKGDARKSFMSTCLKG